MSDIVSRFFWILIGALAFWIFRPSPERSYQTVIVPVEKIIEREPDTVRTFVDRIRLVEVNPIQIAIAPGGAQEQVQEFCSPFILASNADGETRDTPDPSLLLRSVTYDRRWAWRKDRLLLTGPMNNGDLFAVDYNVRGDWTVRTINQNVRVGGDPLLVQYPRTSLLYDVWEGGSQIYAAFSLGKLIFESIN